MRRYINILLYIIGIALTLACTKNEIEHSKHAISFAPVAAKATKAIISGTTYPTSESFVVSSYHNGTAAYFEGLTAAYSSTERCWLTSESQYWPLAGSLDFYAYSPATASGVSITSDGVSATGYTVQTSAQMTTDLCYASLNVANCTAHPDTARLTFSHALSQIVFRAKAADYYSTTDNVVSIFVTSVSLGNIYSVGDFDSSDSPLWSVDAQSKHNYTLSNASTRLDYTGQTPNVKNICSNLFIPQELPQDATIIVSYQVAQTISGTTHTLDNPAVTLNLVGNITEWEPGKKYVYTLNVGINNSIWFTASTDGWTTQNQSIVVEDN